MTKKAIILISVLFCNVIVLHTQQNSAINKFDFTYTCFQNPDKTWGYDILSSGKLFIHQPAIPAIQGVKGFADKQSALKLAELVIKKIKENSNNFPTISIDELKQLRVIN